MKIVETNSGGKSMSNIIFSFTLVVLTAVIIFEVGRQIHIKIKQNIEIKEIENLMKKENLSFEDSRDKYLSLKLANKLKIDNNAYTLYGWDIKQGDRVTFSCGSIGYVSGDFIGLRDSQAHGYTKHFIVRTEDRGIVAAPIEDIDKDTIRVFER